MTVICNVKCLPARNNNAREETEYEIIRDPRLFIRTIEEPDKPRKRN